MKQYSAIVLLTSHCITLAAAWVLPPTPRFTPQPALSATAAAGTTLHGQDSCFLPLKQLDQDCYTPRIVAISGCYPGLTRDEFFAAQSEAAPDPGQWAYDVGDGTSTRGTVALEGSVLTSACDDPVVIIAEHPAVGVQLPAAIKEPVDLLVLVDRAETSFAERAFMVIDSADGLQIAAFSSKRDMPSTCEILGRVKMVQIPWLPAMSPTKTGFMEADEYF